MQHLGCIIPPRFQAESKCDVINAWAAVLIIVGLANLALAGTLWISVPILIANVVDFLYASKGAWNCLRPLSWCAHLATNLERKGAGGIAAICHGKCTVGRQQPWSSSVDRYRQGITVTVGGMSVPTVSRARRNDNRLLCSVHHEWCT